MFLRHLCGLSSGEITWNSFRVNPGLSSSWKNPRRKEEKYCPPGYCAKDNTASAINPIIFYHLRKPLNEIQRMTFIPHTVIVPPLFIFQREVFADIILHQGRRNIYLAQDEMKSSTFSELPFSLFLVEGKFFVKRKMKATMGNEELSNTEWNGIFKNCLFRHCCLFSRRISYFSFADNVE